VTFSSLFDFDVLSSSELGDVVTAAAFARELPLPTRFHVSLGDAPLRYIFIYRSPPSGIYLYIYPHIKDILSLSICM